jgi:hypothetical protein
MAGHVLSGAEGMAMPLNQASPSQRNEADTRPSEKHVDLKKQTQFALAQVDANSFEKGDYDNKPAHGVEENKAKQSQFSATKQLKGAGKRKKSSTATASLAG